MPLPALSLETVNDAISAILAGGQSYRTPDGFTIQRGDLSELTKLRDQLSAEAAQAARAGRGGNVVRLGFRRPS